MVDFQQTVAAATVLLFGVARPPPSAAFDGVFPARYRRAAMPNQGQEPQPGAAAPHAHWDTPPPGCFRVFLFRFIGLRIGISQWSQSAIGISQRGGFGPAIGIHPHPPPPGAFPFVIIRLRIGIPDARSGIPMGSVPRLWILGGAISSAAIFSKSESASFSEGAGGDTAQGTPHLFPVCAKRRGKPDIHRETISSVDAMS